MPIVTVRFPVAERRVQQDRVRESVVVDEVGHDLRSLTLIDANDRVVRASAMDREARVQPAMKVLRRKFKAVLISGFPSYLASCHPSLPTSPR